MPRGLEGESRYRHPAGYLIVSARRTWSERVGAMRGQAGSIPLTWWEVYRWHSKVREEAQPIGRRLLECETLREARAWCDEQERP